MRVALTGIPGTGKTETAKILAARGHNVVSVLELAEKFGAAGKHGGEVEIDVEKLALTLPKTSGILILEGHLAHLIPNDLCIVLRCHPNILRERLEQRNYAEEKVRENLEAEAIDLILIEALERCKSVFEIDASELSSEKIVDAIEKIINGRGDCYLPGKVDWSQVVMDWY